MNNQYFFYYILLEIMSNPAVSYDPVTFQPKAQNQPQVVMIQQGNCHNCQVGFMSKEFTCCGICCGVFFFPLGLICCFAMQEYKCQSCGNTN